MVDMERLGDIPDGEIIENLSFAQVHREKIEELGRDLGIEPAGRTDKPTRLRGMDRFLANIHRPGKIQIAGYGGLIGADISGVTAGLGLIPRTVVRAWHGCCDKRRLEQRTNSCIRMSVDPDNNLIIENFTTRYLKL